MKLGAAKSTRDRGGQTKKNTYVYTRVRARTHTHTQIVQEPYLVYKGKGPNYAHEIQQKTQGKVRQ